MTDYRVYSFDIFDTLLLRPYTDPQEVWKILEEREQVHGFAKARKKADAVTFKFAVSSGGETTIEEAYCMIPQYQYLMEKEMSLEREVLRANPEMLKLWIKLGQEGKRRIIISDMYLPAVFIKSVLCEKGFEGWDGFYLSRDFNVRKSTGRLFEVMLKAENVKPENVLHIGDNPDSDVKQPKALGIQTQHYQKVINRLYNDCPFTCYINGRLSGALAIGWHQYKYDNPHHSYWNKLGYMLGGVLGYLYISWIAQICKRININHLMFVGRDGYILEKICNSLYPEIKTDYFFAPRLTSIAVLGAIGSDPLAIADRQRFINEHLQGVNPKEVKQIYSQYLQQFIFDSQTALVDGCSSAFSAQRLVEETIGHKVFSFYLLAMADMSYAGALYSTHLKSLPFQFMSEFLFGAPTPPVKSMTEQGAIFETDIDKREQYKMNVSDEIANGAIECAKVLFTENVVITNDDWMNYFNIFMGNLTDEDRIELAKAKNAVDVQQKKFGSVIRESYPTKVVRKRLFGHELLTSYFSYIDTYFQWNHKILNRLQIKGFHEKMYDERKIVME